MPLPKISTPTYELTIPSSGKTINYRPFLVKEEKILIIAMESQSDKEITRAVKNVLASCILTKGIKLDDLSIKFLLISIPPPLVVERVDSFGVSNLVQGDWLCKTAPNESSYTKSDPLA